FRSSFSEEVYCCSIRYSAAAIKSSNTFCLFICVPPRCQLSPYSPPPRRFATAYTPPCSSRIILLVEKDGVKLILNPPYPYSIVGFVPSNWMPFLYVMIIGIFVPSLEG